MEYTTNPATVIKGEVNRKIYGEKVIANDVIKMLPALSEVINSFKDKKCFKVDGSKTKAFNDALNEVLNDIYNVRGKRVHINSSYSSGYLSLSYWIAWETFPNDERKSTDGSYIELDFYFFKRENQTLLVKDNWEDEIKTRCNAILSVDDLEVKHKLIDIKELIKQAKEINDSLPYYARVSLPYVD